jgi:predicted porin
MLQYGAEFVLSKTVRQFEPEVAAGISYPFSKKIDANVSYHHVFAGKANPNADSVVDQNLLTQLSAINLIMIGIAYHFA